MLKQIEIQGKKFELKSLDGRLWCSSLVDCLYAKREKERIEESLKLNAKHQAILSALVYPDSSDLPY